VRVPCGTIGGVALTGLEQASEFECTGNLPDSENLRPEACAYAWRPSRQSTLKCGEAGLPS
jgi:hypothetical protein